MAYDPDVVRTRLKQALDRSPYTQEGLADAIGLTKQSVGKWFRTGQVSLENIANATTALGVSVDWILGGDGGLGLQETVEAARKGPIEDPEWEPGPEIKGKVPLISWVQAGDLALVADPCQPGDTEEWLSCPVVCSDKTFALRVSGPSMEPDYQEGEIIFVDPEVAAAPGDDVVVRFEERKEATFKRLRYEGSEPYLEAVNPSWPERYIPINEHAAICGVVIFSGRVRRSSKWARRGTDKRGPDGAKGAVDAVPSTWKSSVG